MMSDKAVDMWDGYGTVRWTKAFVDTFEDGDARKRFPFYFYEAVSYTHLDVYKRQVSGLPVLIITTALTPDSDILNLPTLTSVGRNRQCSM